MTGVWRAVGHNEGAAVIYHSPRACSHVTHDMDLGGQYRSMGRDVYTAGCYEAPLVCSGLREEHSIFGGVEQLQQCIDHVVATYQPQYVMIANSCVAGVIGDDTEAVAKEAEEKWRLPILAVPCHSFLDGDFHAGFYHASRVLAERFMKPLSRQKNRQCNQVTLLGDRGGPASRDLVEMQRLCRYFGFEKFCLFPAYASIREMKRIPESAVSIPMSGTPQGFPWTKKLAGELQESFGVPWLEHDYPVCWTRTQNWLESLGDLLGKRLAARTAIHEQTVELNEQLEQLTPCLQQKRIAFCIGRSRLLFDPAWVFELIELSGVQLVAVVLLSDSLTPKQQAELQQDLPRQTTAPVVPSNEADEIMASVDFAISTHELTDTTLRQLFLPFLPLVGVRGLTNMLQLMARLARRQGNRGGIVYG